MYDLYCQEIVGLLVLFFKRDNWFCHKNVGDVASLKLLLWIKRHLRGALIYTFQIKMEYFQSRMNKHKLTNP